MYTNLIRNMLTVFDWILWATHAFYLLVIVLQEYVYSYRLQKYVDFRARNLLEKVHTEVHTEVHTNVSTNVSTNVPTNVPTEVQNDTVKSCRISSELNGVDKVIEHTVNAC